jgi:hypothetical protein
MNREDIIRMAREAGFEVYETDVWITDGWWTEELERFAVLVSAAEREACAKLCDAVQKKNEDDGAWMWEARNCAAAIRARGDR